MLAVERNHAEIADLLIRAQANVNAANEYGATALFVASATGMSLDHTAPGRKGGSECAAPFG